MLELLLIVSTITTVFLWINAEAKLVKTQKLLNETRIKNQSTPIKELTADFRDFVQSIDGHVSSEVDAVIKNIEAAAKPKALTEEIQIKSIDLGSVQTKPRSVMSVQIWNLFVVDLKTAEEPDEIISVIKRWGKKYLFAIEDQVELIGDVMFDEEEREELREYFDKYHATKILSIESKI